MTLSRTCNENLIGFVVLCVIVFAAYLPGLQGGFFFDDSPNIVLNDGIKIKHLDAISLKQAAFSSSSSLLGRPISMASFALNYYFSGLSPSAFKLTNLLIHLLNALCIFILSIFIFRQVALPTSDPRNIRWAALAVASAWVLHPLNLTSVLLVVQRMTSLASLFTLMGLISYTWARERMMTGKPRGPIIIIAGFIICWPLAVLSKENGALLPLYMLLLECLVFRFATLKNSGKGFLYLFYTITLAAPLLWLLAHTLLHPAWLTDGYLFRDFTLPERLFTESRVLWLYLRLIIAPDLSLLGLFHDDIPISHSLTDPQSTWFAVSGLISLLVLAFAMRKRPPLLSLGIIWFLAGHSIESTVYPLEIAHEHRNYLAMYGLMLATFYYLLVAPIEPAKRKIYRFVALGMILILAAATAVRAQQFGNELTLTLVEVGHHPASARANYEAGRAMIVSGNAASFANPAYYNQARTYLDASRQLGKDSKEALFALIYLNKFAGRPVEQAWIEELKHRLRNTPFLPGDRNHLVNMVDGLIQGTIRLPSSEVQAIFDAALENPSLDPTAKSILFASLRDYYLAALHDTGAALRFAEQATMANPESTVLRLDFAKQLIMAGKHDEAIKQIQLATQTDSLHIYSDQILELQRKLEAYR